MRTFALVLAVALAAVTLVAGAPFEGRLGPSKFGKAVDLASPAAPIPPANGQPSLDTAEMLRLQALTKAQTDAAAALAKLMKDARENLAGAIGKVN
ncbi:hypothetical protein JCM11251_005627 [Rhodosporidiobolus azoricus]